VKRVRYDPTLPTLQGGERQVLSMAQALAVRELVAIEGALTAGDWCTVRPAAIKLAALADGRAAKKQPVPKYGCTGFPPAAK
jgi:hypothetical protein